MKLTKGVLLLAAGALALGTAAPAFVSPLPARLGPAVTLDLAPRPALPTQFSGTDGDDAPSSGGSSGGSGSNSGGRESGAEERRNRGTAAIVQPNTPANDTSTATIVRQMRDVDDNCEKLFRPYRIDCVASEYRDLSKRLPRRGDYAEAKAALERVAVQLEQIAKSNRDRSQRRVRASVSRVGQARPARTRPLSAVNEDALPSAAQQARQVIEQGKQILLRATPSGDPRRVHYQRIASAFDDGAVLLRS